MTKAIRIHELGGPDVLKWEDLQVPSPGPGEALITQTAVGLNFIDVYHRTGLYPVPAMPAVIGSEGAGIVEAVGPFVDLAVFEEALRACQTLLESGNLVGQPWKLRTFFLGLDLLGDRLQNDPQVFEHQQPSRRGSRWQGHHKSFQSGGQCVAVQWIRNGLYGSAEYRVVEAGK